MTLIKILVISEAQFRLVKHLQLHFRSPFEVHIKYS